MFERVKFRLRKWLETGGLTDREALLLKRIDELEARATRQRDRTRKLSERISRDVKALRTEDANLRVRARDIELAVHRETHQIHKLMDWRFRDLQRGARINGMLALGAHAMGASGRIDAPLHRREARVYSQNGEDGIFLHIFEKVGTTDRRFVEIGAGGLENNTNNLFFNFGWSGFWLDMDQGCMDELADYVARCFPDLQDRYRVHVGKVTPDNVNALVGDYCRGTDPDLLTIDIDGYDGHVLRALDVVRPRVLGCEYNGAFGLRNAMVPYDENFSRKDYNRYYYGASLAALNKIAASKGYALIGCDSQGVNCFFVREDALGQAFPSLTPEEAFVPNRRYAVKGDIESHWEMVKELPLEEA